MNKNAELNEEIPFHRDYREEIEHLFNQGIVK